MLSLPNHEHDFCCCCFVTKSCRLFATPWTVVCQAPLSMGFPIQEYRHGLPFPSPGDLPDLGIEPISPSLTDRFFTTENVKFYLPIFCKNFCVSIYVDIGLQFSFSFLYCLYMVFRIEIILAS